MNVLGRLALLFVIIPILELMLLIQLGQVVGLMPTLLLVVFTGVTGAWLARAEGMRVFFQFQKELASGRLPGQALLDGICVLIGGAFLLTPGVLTDLTGFSLLFPPTRRWIQRRVRARMERGIADGTIRVVDVGLGAGGATFGFGGFPMGAERGAHDRGPEAGLDPRKGIEVRSGE
ncbi:MAG: FxsA family protein [Gemmatimonadetes bacterium]|nr:FxsA family protein [Gemmatimonadota bacterium]MDA1102159.1 FxsA family protein [Gemmatimonadota bacterium]